MRRHIKLILVGAFIFANLFSSVAVSAAEDAAPNARDTYYRAKVVEVLEEGEQDIDGQKQEYQKLELTILSGDEKGKTISIGNGVDFIIGTFKKYDEGDKVVVAKPAMVPGSERELYYITDDYRVNRLVIVATVFFALAFYFGRRRGLTSVIGLIFSILVIFYYVVPKIMAGSDPFLTCVIGAVAILLLSLYLSHGFNARTSIAMVSTLLSLGVAVFIDLLFVYLAKLGGNGTEEAFYLQFNILDIDLRGLLLGSIIIGVLGVLDDVTTAQSATVEEIYKANSTLSFGDLYNRGLSVGREHIASLVNTLVLAYVGASFPLLLLFGTQKSQPLWATLNSNFIAEEIVRTLVGSSVLIIAVPLTTILAALYYTRRKN